MGIAGIREKMNRNPAISGAIAAVIIAIAAVALYYHFRTDPNTRQRGAGKSYYIDEDSTDVGEIFADDFQKIIPFEHNNKQAVRVMVWKCAEGRRIGYMMKYNDEMRQKLEERKPEDRALFLGSPEGNPNMLFKMPGGDWVPFQDAMRSNMLRPPCEGATPVMPD